MNERIKELAEQAEQWADNQNFYASDYQDYMMEKFAELIVRECASKVTRNEALNIFEHFGVEE
jgi:hypothetical protein